MGQLKDELKQLSPTVVDHFLNPRNVGELKDATVVASAENPSCQDLVKLYLKVEGRSIRAVKMKTFGCTVAIAATSMLTEMLFNLSVEDATRITERDIAERLGGLPNERLRCCTTPAKALAHALQKSRGSA